MTIRVDRVASVPRYVSLFSPVIHALLKRGIPLGPNAIITIRGRTSGEPRTTPIAIIDVAGRRWVWAPWGDVHWVRNLRAAGRATVSFRGRVEEVTATELGEHERVAFFRDVLVPLARSMPGGTTFVRVVDQVDLSDPEAAAEGRRVFELQAVT